MNLKFMSSKIEELAYGITFDPRTGSGTVAFNTSFVPSAELDQALQLFRLVYTSGLNVAPYVAVAEADETFQGIHVPTGFSGIFTICSITIDGVLLKAGIPSSPVCGGIVQVLDKQPVRFTEVLRYDSTTLDPHDVFLSQELTSVLEMVHSGSGKVLASVREVPMVAQDYLEGLLSDLMKAGFKGILEVGEPNTDLLEMPVSRGHIGIALIGGMNAVAAVKESGLDIRTKAISGLVSIDHLKTEL